MLKKTYLKFLFLVTVHLATASESRRQLAKTFALLLQVKRQSPEKVITRATVEPQTEATPKQYKKSHSDTEFLRTSLLKNVMFTNLPQNTLNAIILAFEKVEVLKDEVIIHQNDPSEGDFVYVIADGECAVLVDGKVVPEPYGTLGPQAIIGELGVLYDQPRAATVKAKTDKVTLYRIDGQFFKSVLQTDKGEFGELEKIDDAIKQIEGISSLYGGDIIQPYKPERFWLWSRWHGTIPKQCLVPTLCNMLFSLVVILVTRRLTDPDLPLGVLPNRNNPIISQLDLVQKIWNYQMSLTTFILTFFVNQAFSFWSNFIANGRRIQGGLNDFGLMLATSAKRNSDGTFTKGSLEMMEDVASYGRMFHVLLWASFAKRFKVLLTDRGLERMATRGLMTSTELEILLNLDIPSNQRYNACMQWMMDRVYRGAESGDLRDRGTVQNLQNVMMQLRSNNVAIGNALNCRMPLAYAHFVQILVDIFCATAPIALYSTLGDYSIICVGILTLFYTGLLDLAKVFLDPLNNEKYSQNSIYMDLGVLIRESNAGSTRWRNAGDRVPL